MSISKKPCLLVEKANENPSLRVKQANNRPAKAGEKVTSNELLFPAFDYIECIDRKMGYIEGVLDFQQIIANKQDITKDAWNSWADRATDFLESVLCNS